MHALCGKHAGFHIMHLLHCTLSVRPSICPSHMGM